MNTFSIDYHFKFEDGNTESCQLIVDAKRIELMNQKPENPAEWTRLEFHQCPNCPLRVSDHPYCPLSLNLVFLVKLVDRVCSYDKLKVVITTAERRVAQQTTAQRAISSLMGVVIATSGCPHTAFFKPMARFHLPFANEEETLFRSAASYLLAQYFIRKEGNDFDFELTGLKAIYKEIKRVNSAIAKRLRIASKTDTSVNSLILLDIYASSMPMVIEESLDELRYLFEPYFRIMDEK